MYTVFYKKETYNPYKTYRQNANRYVGSKSFNAEVEAREFAKTVKESRIYYSGVRVPN